MFFARRGDTASASVKRKLFQSTQRLFAGAKGQERGKKNPNISKSNGNLGSSRESPRLGSRQDTEVNTLTLNYRPDR